MFTDYIFKYGVKGSPGGFMRTTIKARTLSEAVRKFKSKYDGFYSSYQVINKSYNLS